MDFNILYAIQNIRSSGLDKFFVEFAKIVGEKGELWLYIGIALLILPKTRKTGLCLLSSYIIAYFIGDGILKNWIARPRPCMIDESIELLIKRPTSFSCPSVHSALAFASAGSILYKHKGLGIAAIVLAFMVAFSRLYLFVHFPTDVLFGSVLGFIIATLVHFVTKKE